MTVEELIEEIKATWPVSRLHLHEHPARKLLVLDTLVVRPDARGHGAGTEALKAILAYADAKGLRVSLTPEPIGWGSAAAKQDSREFKARKKRLEKWYAAHGFKQHSDFSVSERLLREPRRAARDFSVSERLLREPRRQNPPSIARLVDRPITDLQSAGEEFMLRVLAVWGERSFKYLTTEKTYRQGYESETGIERSAGETGTPFLLKLDDGRYRGKVGKGGRSKQGTLAALEHWGKARVLSLPSARGPGLIREHAPLYRLRIGSELFNEGQAEIVGILAHEVLHLGIDNHGEAFRRAAAALGIPISESATKDKPMELQWKAPGMTRYATLSVVADEKEAERLAQEHIDQRKAAGEPRARYRWVS